MQNAFSLRYVLPDRQGYTFPLDNGWAPLLILHQELQGGFRKLSPDGAFQPLGTALLQVFFPTIPLHRFSVKYKY
jgi:hypothetical protein